MSTPPRKPLLARKYSNLRLWIQSPNRCAASPSIRGTTRHLAPSPGTGEHRRTPRSGTHSDTRNSNPEGLAPGGFHDRASVSPVVPLSPQTLAQVGDAGRSFLSVSPVVLVSPSSQGAKQGALMRIEKGASLPPGDEALKKRKISSFELPRGLTLLLYGIGILSRFSMSPKG